MKAWLVSVKDCFGSTVVFAETRGKAKSIALHTDMCYGYDAEFTDIEVNRLSKADSQYKKGKTEMDWYDPNDRRFLVDKCGFHCEEVDLNECEKCSANDVCDYYQDVLAEDNDNQEDN